MVDQHNKWAAILITVIGGVIMAGVLGTMTYFVVKNKRIRKVKKKEKISRNATRPRSLSESDSEVNTIYAI